jgi:hypothetical protein
VRHSEEAARDPTRPCAGSIPRKRASHHFTPGLSATLHRNQRWRHHCALHPQLRQLPVQYVASRTGFIAGPQLLHRTKLVHQLADRLFPVCYRSQTAYLAVRFGYRDGNRLGMDIQSLKSYLLFHDRSFPLVAALWFQSTHSVTHDQRIGTVTP